MDIIQHLVATLVFDPNMERRDINFYDGLTAGLLLCALLCAVWYFYVKWKVSKNLVENHGYPVAEPWRTNASHEVFKIRRFLEKREKLMKTGYYCHGAPIWHGYDKPDWDDKKVFCVIQDLVMQVHTLGCEILIREYKPRVIDEDNHPSKEYITRSDDMDKMLRITNPPPEPFTQVVTGKNWPKDKDGEQDLKTRWFLFQFIFILAFSIIAAGVSISKKTEPLVAQFNAARIRFFSFLLSHIV